MEKERREKPANEFFANATIKKTIKMRRENIFRRNYQMTSVFVKPIFIVLIIIIVDLIELRFGIFTLRYFLMHQLTSTEQHLFYYLHTSINDQRSNFACDFLSKHIRLIEKFFVFFFLYYSKTIQILRFLHRCDLFVMFFQLILNKEKERNTIESTVECYLFSSLDDFLRRVYTMSS